MSKKEQSKEQSKKTKSSLLINLILILSIILVIAAIIIVSFAKEIIHTEIPGFDPNAVETSEIKDMPFLTTMEHSKGFIVNAMPAITVNNKSGEASIYFTLPETDNVYARCEIYVKNDMLPNPVKTGFKRFFLRKNQAIVDKDGFVLIGQSDLIKPGQTLTKVLLSQIPLKSTEVRIRYISYVPDTYLSGGNFAQVTTIYVVDDNGMILDENGEWIEATIKTAKN